MNFWRAFMLMWLAVSLAGCGINNIPTYDEQVKAAWSQVQNQYQRRADPVSYTHLTLPTICSV